MRSRVGLEVSPHTQDLPTSDSTQLPSIVMHAKRNLSHRMDAIMRGKLQARPPDQRALKRRIPDPDLRTYRLVAGPARHT